MSMNFYVYPKEKGMPCYEDVISLANKYVNGYLLDIGITKKLLLNVELVDSTTNQEIPFSRRDSMKQGEDKYTWFYYGGMPGGTDCRFHNYLSIDKEIWNEKIVLKEYDETINDVIRHNMNVGYFWSTRRTAGQPAHIILAYGMVAAALAALTSGMIFSDDGAWDIDVLPAKADDFVRWYYRPEFAKRMEDVKRSEWGIAELRRLLA